MVNLYLDTEKSLKGAVLPTLERLHKEIKAKSKELQGAAVKSAKAVEKARAATQKHIETLGVQTATFDSAAGNKLEQPNDPYILRRGINHRLNKQVAEENNSRQDILAVQNNFQQFEAHVIQTIQAAMDQFFQSMGGQADRMRAMYADILGSAQNVPPDFEWTNFITQNSHVLVDPDSPPRSVSSITFPNQDHRATKALIEGSLERKSRNALKGYNTGYYVVSPARYLHEFKDDDDFRKDPSPDLSLYLPDCVVGGIDGVKFNVKGKDVSGGKVGQAFHTNTELSFKAHTPADAEKWWTTIKECVSGTPSALAAAGPAAASAQVPSRSASGATEPPAYEEKYAQPASDEKGAAKETASPSAASPSEGVSRSASTATGHFHTAPGGTNAEEKKG